MASKFLSVIGQSTGDYELKKKIRKSDMTIDSITALIHEHMYDQLNESNNSNDGKETKHVQERPCKRKRTDKADQDKWKRRPENQRYKQRDNRCGQCGSPDWTRQHMCPTKMAECRNCKRRGNYEKMCRSTKRVQYIEKTTGSAEEDNWDYNRIQRINDNKTKETFLQCNGIGQQRTNKIHYKHRLASDTNSEVSIQQYNYN